jgi:zinc protease
VRKVTAADVQRVAKQYLAQDNRTVAILIPTKPAVAAPGAGK